MLSGERADVTQTADQPVETLPAQRSDHTLADGIHLRAVRGGSEYADSERLDRLVEFPREDAIAVFEPELVLMIQAEHFAQLLQRPGAGRMSCDFAVDQATASMLDDYEHARHAEARWDGEAKITGEDSSGVQAHDRRPAQVPRGRPGECRGMYLRTVRGETRIPSFNGSSLAMRSSPQMTQARLGASIWQSAKIARVIDHPLLSARRLWVVGRGQERSYVCAGSTPAT